MRKKYAKAVGHVEKSTSKEGLELVVKIPLVDGTEATGRYLLEPNKKFKVGEEYKVYVNPKNFSDLKIVKKSSYQLGIAILLAVGATLFLKVLIFTN